MSQPALPTFAPSSSASSALSGAGARRRRRRAALVGLAVVVGGLLSACGGDDADTKPAATGASAPSTADTVPVNIGYFPNLTHAPALIAEQEGFFTKRIGEGKVKTQSFNAGPDVIQAIFGGSLDISYIGSNPTITAYAQSEGAGVRVIAGAASGGASLVVKPEIKGAADLKGKTLATPQLGNTQDVALRYWLKQNGLNTTTEGGGDVSIKPQKNSQGLQAFVSGQVDGAWVPEPFATQYVQKGAVRLIDETSLWKDGKFVTTNVIVRTQFLKEHPETVRAFLEAHLDAIQLAEKDPAKAQSDVIAQIKKITDQDTKPETVAEAWKFITFSADPLTAALKESANHADEVGLLEKKPSDGFAGLWDLAALNAALKSRGLPEVSQS
ncbi:MAG: ABC transporter substrate-binding protein [Kineosporiaceae bacterium]